MLLYAEHTWGHSVTITNPYDTIEANEEKIYRFEKLVNNYDSKSYMLPYQIENDYFKISYIIGKGIISFYNKVDNI